MEDYTNSSPSYFEVEDCDGGCRITKYTGPKEGAVDVPACLGGKQVLEIGYAAFAFCENLVSIILPYGVTKIGEGAFSFCTSLASVSIPESVTEIGFQAFLTCEQLTNLVIPDSVTEIGSQAFDNCDRLILCVPAGSAAEQYAKEENLPFQTLHL